MQHHNVITFAALALCASSLSAAAPKGLASSDWSSIQAEHQRHRQAAFPVDGGWRARNYGQDWSTLFEGRAFEITPRLGGWRWGLQLARYGYEGQLRRASKAKPTADVEKFSYQWDSALTEWFVNGSEGVEHGFTLGSRPGIPVSAGMRLQLHLNIVGSLTPRVDVAFLDHGIAAVHLNVGLHT